jgi:hypothetical protein
MAAPPASAIRGRCPSRSRQDPRQRSRRRLRPLGQPQFRGPRVAGRARQLPRLAAAGGRLCAQGHGDRGHGRRRRSAPGKDGAPTSILRDIWPTNEEVRALIDQYVNADMFKARYADVYKGDEQWQAIDRHRRRDLCLGRGLHLHPEPALFRRHEMTADGPRPTSSARAPLAIFGDSITTDHISPAGAIKRTARPAPT